MTSYSVPSTVPGYECTSELIKKLEVNLSPSARHGLLKHTAPQSGIKATEISSYHPRVSTTQKACYVGLAQGVRAAYQNNAFVTTASTPTGSAGQGELSCRGNRCCWEADIHTIHVSGARFLRQCLFWLVGRWWEFVCLGFLFACFILFWGFFVVLYGGFCCFYGGC